MTEKSIFAVCQNENEGISIKLVPFNEQTKQLYLEIFDQQATDFIQPNTEEIEFSGDYATDNYDEILTPSLEAELQPFISAVKDGVDSESFLEASDLGNVVAIFTGEENDDEYRILVQRFTSMRILKRGVVVMGDTFKTMKNTAFSIPSSLMCIIENGKLKFRSFSNVKTLFQLAGYYEAATDTDIDQFFASSGEFASNSASQLKEYGDISMRKAIHQVQNSQIMSGLTATEIKGAAESENITLQLDNQDKIVLPTAKTDMKRFIFFLNDGLYTSILTDNQYIANSKRKLP